MFVQDDDVGGQAFESPIFLCFEYLADQRQRIVFSDADQHDWKIARDAVGPEAFLPERVLGLQLRARPERTVKIESPRGESFIQQRCIARNAKMTQRAVAVRGGERKGSAGSAWLAILQGQRQSSLAIRCHAGGKRQPSESTRREPDSLSQADNRIERGTGGVGERASVERLRIVGTSTASQEAAAIGFTFERPLRPTLEACHVHGPQFLSVESTGTPAAEQRRIFGTKFG